jgi:glycosyltransferase involved in cell wall biosynthesis
MSGVVDRSRVFGQLRREVIPYAVDTEMFKPRPKPELRKSLGLPENAVCVLFGADNANERRKGFGYLIQALQLSSARPRQRAMVLVCLGHPNAATADVGLPVINTGYITVDEQISNWYAACDLFVLPSLEDNLPNTVLEAMSSGLAVAAFASGGIPDLVRDNDTGKVAPSGDSARLGEAIAALAADEKLRARLGANARAIALKEHGMELQAQRYIDYYNSLSPPERRASLNASTARAEVSLASMGSHFAEVYYGLLIEAMRRRHSDEPDSLPYRRRKFGRQRLVLAWHYLRLYHRVLNRVHRVRRRQ